MVSVHQDTCDMCPQVLELAVVEDCLDNDKCELWSWVQCTYDPLNWNCEQNKIV